MMSCCCCFCCSWYVCVPLTMTSILNEDDRNRIVFHWIPLIKLCIFRMIIDTHTHTREYEKKNSFGVRATHYKQNKSMNQKRTQFIFQWMKWILQTNNKSFNVWKEYDKRKIFLLLSQIENNHVNFR